MNNALLYIGGFLVVVLTALFAGPHFVDWNSYRGVFEEEASRVLGRDVRVGGAVNLRLLPAPYVSLEKLKIADPGSETGDSLLRAESFTLWLSVPPLLKGVLEANKIEIRRPVVQLVSGANGQGNWQTLSLSAGQIPLVPEDVSLQSVHIIDGTVVLGTTSRSDIARFEGINGELAAEAIEGPYKFSGTMADGTSQREVRLATSAPDQDGKLRYKVSVKSEAATYAVAGTAADFKSNLTFDGDLTATLTIPASKFNASGNALKADVTAKLSGDTRGFDIKDLSMSLDAQSTPQVVTGTLKVAWPDRTKVAIDLNSRLLDLDRITGNGEASPLSVAREIAEAFSSQLPNEADTDATISLDQLTLGGELLSGIQFSSARAGGISEIKDFRASLPGGARTGIKGTISGEGEKKSFNGQVTVRGQSLLKLAKWAMGGDAPIPHQADGPFMLEGRLGLSPEGIDVTEAAAEIAGTPLTGDVNVSTGSPAKVSMAIEGDQIDAGLFWPGILDPGRLMSRLKVDHQAASTNSTIPNDIRVRLRAAKLSDGARSYSNVDADLISENGKLSVPKLKLTTHEGISVDINGGTEVNAAAASANATPTIVLRGTVGANSAAGVAALVRGIGLRDATVTSDAGIDVLAPLNLAGSLEVGGRSEVAALITFDGSAGSARLTGRVNLDGGIDAPWTAAPASLFLNAVSQDIVATSAAVLSLRKGAAAPLAIEPKPGQLSIVARSGGGGPVLVNTRVDAVGLSAGIEGTMVPLDTGMQEFTGKVALKTDDARHALALAGLRAGSGIGAVPLDGSFTLSAQKSGWTVSSKALTAGESKLAGTLSFQSSDSARPSFAVDVDVQSATVPGLLAFLTTDTVAVQTAKVPDAKGLRDSKLRRAAAAAAEPVAPLWPLQSFDANAFNGPSGSIKARFASLAFEPGMALREAELEANISPGIVDVVRLEGSGLGGEIRSKIKFEKSNFGTNLTGQADYNGGKNTAKIAFTGSGTDPATLIDGLAGQGELVLEEVALNGNSPAAVSAVAETFIGSRGKAAAGMDVELELVTAVKTGTLQLGAMTLPLSMESGVLRLGTVKIDSSDGRATNDTSVDLRTLKLDSEWRIEPRVVRVFGSTERILLAPVTVAYSGKLKDLGTLEPMIVTSALERELAVRKMERGVEELERLRHLDEQKAKEEKERRNADEAARLKTEAAAKAAAEANKSAAAAGLPPPETASTGTTALGDPAAAAIDGADTGATATGAAANPNDSTDDHRRPSTEKPIKRKPALRETWKPFQVSPYQ